MSHAEIDEALKAEHLKKYAKQLNSSWKTGRAEILQDTQEYVLHRLAIQAVTKASRIAPCNSIWSKIRALYSNADTEAAALSMSYLSIAHRATELAEAKKSHAQFKPEFDALVEQFKETNKIAPSFGCIPFWSPNLMSISEVSLPFFLSRHPRFFQFNNTFHRRDILAPSVIQDLAASQVAYRWYGDILRGAQVLAAVSAVTLVPWQVMKQPALVGVGALAATVGAAVGLHYKAEACYKAAVDLENIAVQEGQVLITMAEEMRADTELDPKKSFIHMNRKIETEKDRVAKTVPRSYLFAGHSSLPLYFLTAWARTAIDVPTMGYDGPWRKGFCPASRAYGAYLHYSGQAPQLGNITGIPGFLFIFKNEEEGEKSE